MNKMKNPARLASKSKKKFAKLHSPSARFANFSRHPGLFGLAAIAIATAGLVIVSGLAASSFGGLFRTDPDFLARENLLARPNPPTSRSSGREQIVRVAGLKQG